MKVGFDQRVLQIDDVDYLLDIPIIDAVADDVRVYVVFDYMAFPQNQPAKNLVAFDKNGQQLWTVSGNPIDYPTAAYTNIIKTNPLTVGNFAGFSCVVNGATGELTRAMFTK